MSLDDKPKALPLPGALIDPAWMERGGADANALTSVQRAIADASTRTVAPANAAETADAARRRQLVTEIHAMQRAKSNVAIEGLISGAKWGAVSQLAWEGIKWWRDSRVAREHEAQLAATRVPTSAPANERKTLPARPAPKASTPRPTVDRYRRER